MRDPDRRDEKIRTDMMYMMLENALIRTEAHKATRTTVFCSGGPRSQHESGGIQVATVRDAHIQIQISCAFQTNTGLFL